MESLNSIIHVFWIGMTVNFEDGTLGWVEDEFPVQGGITKIEDVRDIHTRVLDLINEGRDYPRAITVETGFVHLLRVEEFAYSVPLFNVGAQGETA